MLIRKAPCEGCPAESETQDGQPARRGCRIQAEEAADIALHGQPWGDKVSHESGERWRERQRRRIEQHRAALPPPGKA